MIKLFLIELKKFKRKKIFYYALLMALIFPLLGTALIARGNDADFSSLMSFVREESGFLLLMPILVILAVNSFFMEIDNDTIKNLLTIPIRKKKIILSKLLVLLLFSLVFHLIGFIVSIGMSILYKIPLIDLGLNFLLTLATSFLLWAAALPCILIVVWLDKSYLLSVILVFVYTLVNYLMHFSETILMQDLGFNLASLMPIPLIFRWLYQFQKPIGPIQIEFYNRFSQYFISTGLCFLILTLEAIVSVMLMIWIYEKREV